MRGEKSLQLEFDQAMKSHETDLEFWKKEFSKFDALLLRGKEKILLYLQVHVKSIQREANGTVVDLPKTEARDLVVCIGKGTIALKDGTEICKIMPEMSLKLTNQELSLVRAEELLLTSLNQVPDSDDREVRMNWLKVRHELSQILRQAG